MAVFAEKAFSFGEALLCLKNGERVCRVGWNGKGMWLVLVPGHEYLVRNDGSMTPGIARLAGKNYATLPWIGMKTADDKFVPWAPSQVDVLAEDWETAP